MSLLAPNPKGGISRIRIISNSDNQIMEVINVDPFFERPDLLKEFNPGYTFAIRLWGWVSGIFFWGSIALSFFWNWWAFIPGLFFSSVIHESNRKSSGDFAIEALNSSRKAFVKFRAWGLIFDVDRSKIKGSA